MNQKKKRSKYQLNSKGNWLIILTGIIFFAYLLIIFISHITVNVLWFQEVDYISTFFTQTITKVSAVLVTITVSGLFIGCNSHIANKQITLQKQLTKEGKTFFAQSPQLNLRSLLPIIVSFVILISSILLYFTTLLIKLSDTSIGLPNLKPLSSFPLILTFLPSLETISSLSIAQIALLTIVITIVLIVKTKLSLNIISLYYLGIVALIADKYWFRFLHFFNAVPFNEVDPIFGNDISFYLLSVLTPLIKLVNSTISSFYFY